MKLIGYTCTYNEEYMIPFVMPYVERMGYDKFIVYDNMSTDNTVKKLKEYPFVEVREWNEEFSDVRKANIFQNGYLELQKIAFENNEDIWMTITDFDEVIFCQWHLNAKSFLNDIKEIDYGFNFLETRMLNICPFSKEFNIIENKGLIHMNKNMKASWWYSGGRKPLMIKVNDISYMNDGLGNHAMIIETYDNKDICNLSETGLFSAFHLKFISYDMYRKHIEDYVSKNNYLENKQLIDFTFDSIIGSSFSIENYFLNKGECTLPYEGLHKS